MPTPEILRTIVTPDDGGTFVELQISDGLLPRGDGAMPITLAMRVGAYETPMVAHLQHEALELAIKVLQELRRKLQVELQDSMYPHPRPSKPEA